MSVGVGGISLAGAGLVVERMTGAANAAGDCPNNHHAHNYGATGKYFNKDGAYIRTGDSNTCTGLGLGYKSQTMVQWCGIWNGVHYWDYMRDSATGVLGWVRDDDMTSYYINGCA